MPPFSLKKGASAPFLREKGVPAKKMIPKCTDQNFLRYRYSSKYQEIPTNTDRKIPIRYTTLVLFVLFAHDLKKVTTQRAPLLPEWEFTE